MKTVVDVNVLFALLAGGHPHHTAAWKWWQRQSDGHIGLCWLTRMAVLRLLTNIKAMGGQPATPEEALAAWNALAVDPRCLWLEADAAHEPFLRQFVTGRQPSPNLWSDAWLAALAASKGYQLTSFDADFRSFHLANFEHLKPERWKLLPNALSTHRCESHIEVAGEQDSGNAGRRRARKRFPGSQ